MHRHLILYDGACGLCRRAIAWVERHDWGRRFDAVPYQDVPLPPMTPSLRAACARTVHVFTRTGPVLRSGRATLFILRELGWRRITPVLASWPFVWLVELGYHIVATNRHVFSKLLFTRDHELAGADERQSARRRDD